MRAIRRAVRLLPVGIAAVLAAGALFLLLGRVERTVEAAGRVSVERYQVVRPRAAGLVSAVFVEPGEEVARGQLLLALVDHELQRDLIAVEQSLHEVRARLEQARLERRLLGEGVQPLEVRKQAAELGQNALETALGASRAREAEILLEGAQGRLAKFEKLAEAGLVSRQDLEQARRDKELAEQRLAQARLEEKLARTRRPALDDGLELLKREQHRRLSALAAEIGSLEEQATQWTAQRRELERLRGHHAVRAEMAGVVTGPPMRDLLGRAVRPGDDLFNIIDVTSISFLTRVPEQGIVRVRAGQSAYVEIAGLPKQRFDVFEGAVEVVDQQPAAGAEGEPSHYPVRIQLDTPWINLAEGRRFYLRSGMQGVARIAYRRNVPLFDALFDALLGRSEVRPRRSTPVADRRPPPVALALGSGRRPHDEP